MATRQMNPMNRMVRHLRRAVLLKDQRGLSDGRLLEAFISAGDEAAFEILVKRHGPMVLGVCNRIIGNVHDAEDAFQAVFLVLARKAGTIVPREHVGNWLYGVAYRTALHARAKLGRRRAHEIQVNDMPHPMVAPDLDLHELHRTLDLELNKLPDKYRVPIVLCDLEARSRKEVAGQLRIAEGTLSSRLATGRQRLARRLARHGLTLAGGALATTLVQQVAAAGMSSSLVATTVKVAALAAAGESAAGLLSAHVLALSQGVLKTMLLQKFKMISLIVLAALVGGVGVGVVGVPGRISGPAVQAAQPAASGQTQNTRPDNPEAIDGGLLLDPKIQEELHLSKSQVERLKAVSREADAKNGGKKKEIEEIQKRIAALQQQIAQIQKSIEGEHTQVAKVQTSIYVDRTQAVSTAAPGILSDRAVKRVREIQRQNRGLAQLLQDPKVQRMLKINDEQWRKIEDILKKQPTCANAVWLDAGNAVNPGNLAVFQSLGVGLWENNLNLNQVRSWENLYRNENKVNLNARLPAAQIAFSPDGKTLAYAPFTYPQNAAFGLAAATYATYDTVFLDNTPRQLLEVLSDSQKKTLLEWLGAPYQSQPWQEAWEKHVKNRK